MATGTTVEIATTPGPTGTPAPLGAQFFVAGLTDRGPVDRAVLVESFATLVAWFGARVSYGAVHDSVASYLSKGNRVRVARTAGATATVGTVTLMDRAGVPVAAVRVDAIGPGASSSEITAQVAEPTPGLLDVTIRGHGFTEIYRRLESAAAVAAALTGSKLVKGTDLGGGLPAVVGPAALSAGNDQRGTVDGAGYVATLDAAFPESLGRGAVAVPGQPPSAIGAGIDAHAAATGRRAILAAPIGSTPAQAAAMVASAASRYATIVYPGVTVDDGAGGTRVVTGEGFAAACRASAYRQVGGPWLSAAAVPHGYAAPPVVGVERVLTRAELEAANDARLSVLRAEPDGAPRLFGWRSTDPDATVWRSGVAADLVSEIEAQAEVIFDRYLEQDLDIATYKAVEGDTLAYLDRLAAAGAFAARGDDPGYRVAVAELNTDDDRAARRLVGLISVRPPAAAESALIRINVSGPAAGI